MTDSKTPIRRRIAPLLRPLAIGDAIEILAETSKDVKRIHSKVSQFGITHDRGFRGKLDWRTRLIRVERVR